MNKAIAVLISDVHFTPATLEVATAAYRQAIAHAVKLGVPLIDMGDVMDTKAVVRAEVSNRLVELMREAQLGGMFFIVGNHTRINEKGKEHSLNFLEPWAVIVDELEKVDLGGRDVYMLGYQGTAEEVQAALKQVPPGSILLTHTGLQTAFMGHYTQDKTSLPPSAFDGITIVSGHYHRRQTIDCGTTTFSYVGNAYTLSFGEANDPSKGFAVLFEDGSLEHVDTDLRRHIALDWTLGVECEDVHPRAEDLVRLRLRGPQSEFTEELLRGYKNMFSHCAQYRLDIIPDAAQPIGEERLTPSDTPADVLDTLIDALPDSGEHKEKLKALWRTIHEG